MHGKLRKISVFERDKYKNLMHHVIYRAGDREGFGLTKLFKVLWFFEARRYTVDGELFTGARYTRDEHGPRPTDGYKLLTELERSGAVQLRRERFFSQTLRRATSRKPPQGGLLSESQARDLEYWINYVAGRTAGQVSDESHNYGWEIIPQGAEIPLVALLAERVRPPEGDELDWATRRARELGLP